MQKYKNKKKCNQGFAMAVTMVAIIVALIFLALLGVYLRQNLYSASLQQINMKAYYLAKASGEMVGAVLMDDLRLLADPTEKTDTITHTDKDGNMIGKSTITMKNETIDRDEWKVVRITTTIPDYRTGADGNTNPDYVYKYRIHINTDNPLARLYYID